MGVDLEKKRKLLLYPREYQRGSRCEWVLGFARTAVMRAGTYNQQAQMVSNHRQTGRDSLWCLLHHGGLHIWRSHAATNQDGNAASW